MSVPMIEWPWKAGHEGSNVQADLLNNAHIVWSRTIKFGRTTDVGELRVTATPLPQGVGAPVLPNFCVRSSIYMYTHCRSITKFDVATHVGRELVLWVSHAPSKGAGSQRSPVFVFLLLRTPFAAELPNLAW